MIGAYFSKPDWHNENYWDPFFSTPTRNPNYDIKKYPKKWAKYQQYTANQIDELMSDYGRIDILWLDGGWVRKPEQDIKLDEIVDNARKNSQGLLPWTAQSPDAMKIIKLQNRLFRKNNKTSRGKVVLLSATLGGGIRIPNTNQWSGSSTHWPKSWQKVAVWH